ncbi:MAG: tol-pal system protein YbgF [Alphaproteobacteria bacterium]|nr:tol-pal system protein YbgF [Alphaproteobacteria bacterium]
MKILKLFLVATISVLPLKTVKAQNAMQMELMQLREDIQVLQRKLYREQQDGIAPAAAQDVAVKIGEFDETLRQTVGRVDELEFKIKSLNDRLDVMNKDFDVRFKMIEGKPIEGVGLAMQTAETKKYDAPVAQGAPTSITGGAISKGDDLPDVKTKTADEIYKQAMENMNAGKYSESAQQFTSLMTKYPDDKLAGNAQYWLGEVYYAQKDYTKAAVAFAKGLEKYKHGNKGADSLLKLGMSMRELGKKEEACTAFKTLPTEFPKADQTLKTKSADFAKALECK